MENIIEGLQKNIIITKENVVILKNYISQKYPSNTNKENSLVFADCINKILDKNMQQFDEVDRLELKRSILKNAVNKKNFTVNAADIFDECRRHKQPNDDFMNNLLNWVNLNQESKITHDGLNSIIHRVKNDIEDVNSKRDVLKTKDKIQVVVMEKEEYNSVIAENIYHEKQGKSRNYRSALLLSFTFLCMFIMLQGGILLNSKTHKSIIKNFIKYISSNSNNSSKQQNTYNNRVEKSKYENNLEKHLKYINVDVEKLRNWLKNKNSILADEPYLSSILQVAKKYNINPLLLIAITGQEQGFVPRSNKYAKKIANNPYNVYVSWKEYNTNINDATEIAARTLIHLSKDKPQNADSIKWINRRYAEDKNWWRGVGKIFNKLSLDICQ